jgi:hypothetical protein
MLDLLFLVFAFPVAGFVILAFARGRLTETPAAIVGVGSVGLSALVTLLIGIEFLLHPPADHAYTQVLWTWMSVGGFAPQFALRLDALSLTMLGVITGVGFFIHLFAAWYMRGDDGYDRFFSYMNLFVASMIFLVLGDNLLFLYFGWEGVGLCSYLLIGFWFKDAVNGAAARKAFVVTRVGDTLMVVGLFILFHALGTLNIQELMVRAPNQWAVGSDIATIAALLLLGGAVGKSAQLPLQTWLPDAMAGPTPVSALIHAATMVTAGVYLIARTHVLFELSPLALDAVGWDGTVYPWGFPILNFQPRVSSVHLPPTWHGTFAAKGALICSFVPRPVDFHPEAIPCPYPHSSTHCDEIIFYCEGNFTSRRGVAPGSISPHPMGLPHGPQPGSYEKSLGTTHTDELAVMADTYTPLWVKRRARVKDSTSSKIKNARSCFLALRKTSRIRAGALPPAMRSAQSTTLM